jgi:hypothetical protein
MPLSGIAPLLRGGCEVVLRPRRADGRAAADARAEALPGGDGDFGQRQIVPGARGLDSVSQARLHAGFDSAVAGGGRTAPRQSFRGARRGPGRGRGAGPRRESAVRAAPEQPGPGGRRTRAAGPGGQRVGGHRPVRGDFPLQERVGQKPATSRTHSSNSCSPRRTRSKRRSTWC